MDRPALPARVVVGRAGSELGCAGIDGLERPPPGERRLGLGDELGELVQEPWMDARALVDLVYRDPPPQSLEETVKALCARFLERGRERLFLLWIARFGVEL